jgi:hypothetical protein
MVSASHLKINRRDLVKLGVTVGLASALGAPIVKLAMSRSAQREVAAPRGQVHPHILLRMRLQMRALLREERRRDIHTA